MAVQFNKAARLRIRTGHDAKGDWLAIMAEPDKGDPDEEDALQAVKQIAQALDSIVHLKFCRNTSKGDRTDHIVIYH